MVPPYGRASRPPRGYTHRARAQKRAGASDSSQTTYYISACASSTTTRGQIEQRKNAREWEPSGDAAATMTPGTCSPAVPALQEKATALIAVHRLDQHLLRG